MAFWHNLDFAKVNKEIAAHLTDEDVGGVLACIAAICKIDTVKLTHLVNITGEGLEPLRCSTSVKRLDLSLVDRTSDSGCDLEHRLLEGGIILILDSIISADDFSLHHIQFPRKWREERSQMLTSFFVNLNCIMNEQETRGTLWKQ